MKINSIKLMIFALAVVSWMISSVHLLAVIFAEGPLMPWLIINIISGAYWWAVAVATDMKNERKEKMKNGKVFNSGKEEESA